LFIPHVIYGMDNHGGMRSTGGTPDLSTRALWQSYQKSDLVTKQEELGEGNYEFRHRSIFVNTWKWFTKRRKTLRYESDGFTAPLKEGVLRVFIVLKYPSPSEGFDPANIGSNGKHANHDTMRRLSVIMIWYLKLVIAQSMLVPFGVCILELFWCFSSKYQKHVCFQCIMLLCNCLYKFKIRYEAKCSRYSSQQWCDFHLATQLYIL
jgi:hypothetical protein